MPKNIVLFSDGTGNSSAKLFKTNVWRLYEATDLRRPDQIAYYDDGVGTSPFKPYALLGGALGLGLKRNVKHIYAFLCRNYEAGDRIYAFGFSRGAFTIRILIGLVHNQGLASAATESELWRLVEARWRAYRKHASIRILRELRKRMYAHTPSTAAAANPQVKFTFVGLWDTVAAYGLPADELTRAWDQYVWPLSMSDRIPSSSIEKAFHALSLDDERQTFHPVLWTEVHEPHNATSTHLDNERISQVWFTGAHSNIGGGYSDDSLSFVSLDWIMQEACNRGLRLIPGALEQIKAELTWNGPIYDSRKGIGGYYRYCPRRITKLIDDSYHDVKIARPKIHASVFGRIASGDDHYAPIVLPGAYAVVNANGAISGSTIETAGQASARAKAQEEAWDIVWKRRVVYFLTLLASGFLLIFPALFETGIDGACLSNHFCQLSKPLAWLKPLLPAFTDRWIDAFRSNPGWFAAGIAALFFLLSTSARLKNAIRDRMRLIWNGIVTSPASPASAAPGLIYRLRTSKWYQAFFHGLTRFVVPTLFAIAFYYCLFALLSRVETSGADAIFGAICTDSKAPAILTSKASFSFETSNPCAASGYALQKGARYRVWIQVDNQAQWSDANIVTDLAGFSADKMTAPMYLALPFRRSISEPWFKPIARIGGRSNDSYVLEPSRPFTKVESRDRLYTEILARRDGELFLYVNDALVVWPWLHYYGNNQGRATVTVERIEAPTPAGKV